MSQNTLQKKGTENYAGAFGAIMSMAGMCIGLGNVYRFPYMVGSNGGGAFVIAYLICVILVVMPMCIVEAGFGKGIGKGMFEAYGEAVKNKTAGKIIGGISSLVYYTMNFYFVPVMAMCFYFIYACATGMWNSEPADQIYDIAFANKPLMIGLVCVNLLIMGFILFRGVSGGIEGVSKIMVPGMFVLFLIIILFGLFSVDEIGKGYNFYLYPDFSVWAHPSLWVAAMGQALFSVGVGPGCVLIYGAHLKKGDDVSVSLTATALIDTAIALVAGMAMITTCVGMGIAPDGGTQLIFYILPAVFASLPLGQLLGVFCFLAIWFAAVTSAVAQSEVAVVSFAHGVKGLSRKKNAIILSIINAVMSIICVYSQEFQDFWNNFSGNYGFIVTAGIGSILYGYIYGVDKIRTNFINSTSDIKLGAWFTRFVQFFCIPVLVIIMVNSLFPFIGGEAVDTTQDLSNLSNTLQGGTVASLVFCIVIFAATCFFTMKAIKNQPIHDKMNAEIEAKEGSAAGLVDEI